MARLVAAHMLQQDIVNFTIHLRTKKEMSKVPAHYELIPEIIKALRDEIGPRYAAYYQRRYPRPGAWHGAVDQYGVDGIMIGRGVFHNPFCFAADEQLDYPI